MTIADPSRISATTRARPKDAVAQVLLLGRPGTIHEALRSALVDRQVAVIVDPRELQTPETGDALVILTTDSAPVLRRRGLGGWRERAARQAREDHLTDAVVDASTTVPGFRVLLLCDASGETSPRDAISATRQLGQRMAYECELNGAPISSTTYVVVDAETPAIAAINAAVTWYFTHQTPAIEDRPY